MVISCSAYGCVNRWSRDSQRKFHKFPLSDPIRLKLWVHAVRRKSWFPTIYSYICSDHFSEDSYKSNSRRYLKDDAVPSIFEFNCQQFSKKKQIIKNPRHLVCTLLFKNSDIEAKASAQDSKTERAITAPLMRKRLKKNAVPSLLIPPLSSASREDPEENWVRKEAEQLNFDLKQVLKNIIKETSKPKDLTESNSNPSSPPLRNLQTDDEVIENQKRKATKRKRKSEIETSKEANSAFGSNSTESCHSSNIQESPQSDNLNFNRNNFSNSTSLLQKEKSEAASETLDAAFYKTPLKIDMKNEVFAKFVSYKMSELQGNPELYLRTQKSILNLLVEAEFELMSS